MLLIVKKNKSMNSEYVSVIVEEKPWEFGEWKMCNVALV